MPLLAAIEKRGLVLADADNTRIAPPEASAENPPPGVVASDRLTDQVPAGPDGGLELRNNTRRTFLLAVAASLIASFLFVVIF